MRCSTAVFFGEELAKYGFGGSHPMGSDRIYAFWSKFQSESEINQINRNTKTGFG